MQSGGRPEGTRAPQDFYDEKEARKYNGSSRIINIQAEITKRAVQMLSLPDDKSCYLLDVGCGSGLSGEVIEDLGHYWVGCDISSSMLEVANERETSSTGNLIHSDMGQGLPFRPGTFDGVISISALQWLCYSESNEQDPKLRLNRFFSSLYSILKRNAKAVLQFYPENPEQALLIAQSASKVGFTGGIVIDYPNSSKAKKYYLCLSFERSYTVPTALGMGIHGSGGGIEVVGKETKRGRAGRKDVKSKEWIMAKKERMKKQGKSVKTDSKFTGRKRKDRF
jgi:18S rRNA (guanine1575-N7)-methyltransferase